MEGRKCQVHKIQQLERPLDDDRFHFQDGVEDDVDDDKQVALEGEDGYGSGGDDLDGVEDNQDDCVELMTIMLMAMTRRPSCRW